MKRTPLALLTVLLTALATGGFAMIEMLSLADLVRHAEIVAVVRIGPATPAEAPAGATIPWASHELIAEKVIKGQDLVQGPLALPLPRFDNPRDREEDSVVLPPEGERAVVFLKKGDDGRWRTVNLLQGVWPLETGTDKPCGPGTGQTLADVEKAVAEGK